MPLAIRRGARRVGSRLMRGSIFRGHDEAAMSANVAARACGSWDWQACRRISEQRVGVAAPGSGVRRRDAMWHVPHPPNPPTHSSTTHRANTNDQTSPPARPRSKKWKGERTEETNASTLVRVTSHVTISPKIHCKQTQM